MEVNDQDPEVWIQDQQRNKFEQFRENEVVGDHCKRCELSPNPVVKRGSLNADLMVVGEFPTSRDFEESGPFSGELGELIDEMLGAIDLDSENNCYLTNALLCGGENQDLSQSSIEACYTNVSRQVELVSPEVVLGLGKYAYCSLYGKSVTAEFSDQWGAQGPLPDFPWVEGVISVNPIHILKAESGSSRETKLKKLCWSHLKTVGSLLQDSTSDHQESSSE